MIDNWSRYIYEVYRLKSVSLAAKKLYISQPALSSAIKKVEKELGTAIFNRKTFPFTLTIEGRIYIDAIEKMLSIENETKHKILDLADVKSGILRIGASTHISYYAIPKICEIFHQKYPQIEISVEHTDTASLMQLLKQNRVDLIFTSNEFDTKNMNVIPLFEENYIVVLPKKYAQSSIFKPYTLTYDEIVNRSYDKSKKVEDMSIFQGIEFIYAPHSTNVYKKRKLLFGESGLSPYITSNLTRQQLNYNLMLAGLGALFTTDAVAATMGENKECLYFAIDDIEAKQDFNIIYQKDEQSLSIKIIEEFASVAKDLFNRENPLSILAF